MTEEPRAQMNQPSIADMGQLAQAFAHFNQLSDDLIHSYAELQAQIETLQHELHQAHEDRRSEAEQRERLARRHDALLDALPAGVVVIDGSGTVQSSNPAARDLLGEPLNGAAWRAVIGRAFMPRPDDGPDVSLADGRRVNISTCPLGGEASQIVLLVEVTENRRLQALLERQKRLGEMGQMASSLAHQIRTPIASALLYCSHLQRQGLGDEERLRVADRLVNQMRHLERLVNDMLVFARGGGGGRAPVVLGDLLEALRQQVALQPEGAERVAFHIPDGGAQVLGNGELLQSSLHNLVTNGLQVAERVEVRVERVTLAAGEGIDIRVEDNGPGVDPAHVERLFEPFFTTRQGGTGLGLAVVRAVARSHHGDAWYEPRSEGGSRFIVRLPLWTPTSASD